MGPKFQNPTFNILCKITFIFLFEISTLWSSEASEAILEQVKVAE